MKPLYALRHKETKAFVKLSIYCCRDFGEQEGLELNCMNPAVFTMDNAVELQKTLLRVVEEDNPYGVRACSVLKREVDNLEIININRD